MAFEISKPSLSLLFMTSILAPSFIIVMVFCSAFPRAACISFADTAALGNETDQQALLAFKHGLTGDPLGALSSWNRSVHFCQWAGVTCGRRHQRVVVLRLDNQGLKGPISPHIGNLSFLRLLVLRNNSLEQQVPPEIGRLRRLQKMSLYNNSMSGEIPVNISGCSSLVGFELSMNNLEGVIPAEIGNSLPKLERMYVPNNRLSGVIPFTLANLSSLWYLDTSYNDIHGSIPDQLGQLKDLEYFIVEGNKLVGAVPPSMYNISSIKTFSLHNNQLNGSLPSQLGGTIFPNLETLSLSVNLFHGDIPVSISNASNLINLQLGVNKFTGNVPSMHKLKHLQWINLQYNSLGTAGKADDFSFMYSLINSSRLRFLGLDDNNFGGEIPHSIANLSAINLATLYLSDNEISGSIPDGIGNLLSLQTLELQENRFTGNIPSTISKLTALRFLNLSTNRLNGTIALSFGNLSLLLYVYLDENNLHGTVPSSIGKCSNLLHLFLSSNNLHGTIPREIFSISSLSTLHLHHNQFAGSLPIEIGGLINIDELFISNNLLSGKLPSTIGTCVRLNILDVSSNNFGGILPSSLSSLRGLEVLDLSRNNFSGKVPDYLASFMFLQLLNLSFNDFEGDVPERGIFRNTTALDVRGNVKICGGVRQLQLPRCNSKTLKKNLNVKLIVGLVCGVAGVVLLLIFCYLYFSKKSTNVPSLARPGNPFLNLSYQSLREATNGFSAENLIGTGSFGSVYKGLLDQGQQMVAVKVLNLQCRGATRSFMAECDALRSVRHRNLLKVITACSSIDHQGNDFKALVYEFMPNGSLDDWLHPTESEGDLRSISLSQRIDISIDVGNAIEYLHDGGEEPIVHCDLKPSNVLLDNDMIGHVGDFGLVKFLHEGTTNQSSENQSSTIGLRGSVGYVAPEYGMGNEVSTSGDVYSYGILLLEMFTGKRPTDHHELNGCLNLHEYVKMALPEQVADVVDLRLLNQASGDEGASTSRGSIEDCLVSLLEIGIACSRELPGERTAVSDAVVQLHVIKKAFLGTTGGEVDLQRRLKKEWISQSRTQ